MTNIVKQVEFMGDTLTCVKNEQGIFVGIRWICLALGLSDRQAFHQMRKLQADIVLHKSLQKIVVDTQGYLAIDITYLPLWLAKINANIVNIDVQGKLVEYQLKAKEVLADAFSLNVKPDTNSSIPQLPKTYQEALRQLADAQDTIELNSHKVKSYDTFISANGNQTISQVAKVLGTGRDRLFAFLRSKGILMSNNEPYQRYINEGYFDMIEGVSGGYVRGRTMVTPCGVVFIDLLLNPEWTAESKQRFIGYFKR